MIDTFTFDSLKHAVESRSPVLIQYGNLFRYVCPHMLGTTKDKGIVLHGYQYKGDTSSGTITDPLKGEWRFFYATKMQGVTVLPQGEWYPAPDLLKSEPDAYKPPAFVTKVYALAKRQ